MGSGYAIAAIAKTCFIMFVIFVISQLHPSDKLVSIRCSHVIDTVVDLERLHGGG